MDAVVLDVEIKKFRPDHNPEHIDSLVECYRTTFADQPWNEWKKCPVCGQKWGLDSQAALEETNFVHCGQTLEDYWPSKKVRQDILHEVTDRASCWLTFAEDKVIGFCWGYPITPEALEAKLQLPGLAQSILSNFELDGNGEVMYQDELGVLHEYRGRHLASRMYAARREDFRKLGLHVSVVRTKRNPPSLTYLWFKNRLQYRLIGEYNDPDDRVVLAVNMAGT